MVREREIQNEIERFVSTLPANHEFSTNWFKTTLSKLYNRPEGSYIPSDYCYNIANKGIDYDKQPHYFIALEVGKYKYVGKDYIYTGEVEHNARKKGS